MKWYMLLLCILISAAAAAIPLLAFALLEYLGGFLL